MCLYTCMLVTQYKNGARTHATPDMHAHTCCARAPPGAEQL